MRIVRGFLVLIILSILSGCTGFGKGPLKYLREDSFIYDPNYRYVIVPLDTTIGSYQFNDNIYNALPCKQIFQKTNEECPLKVHRNLIHTESINRKAIYTLEKDYNSTYQPTKIFRTFREGRLSGNRLSIAIPSFVSYKYEKGFVTVPGNFVVEIYNNSHNFIRNRPHLKNCGILYDGQVGRERLFENDLNTNFYLFNCPVKANILWQENYYLKRDFPENTPIISKTYGISNNCGDSVSVNDLDSCFAPSSAINDSVTIGFILGSDNALLCKTEKDCIERIRRIRSDQIPPSL